MVWHPKNLREAAFPVSVLHALIGNGCFQYPIGHQRVFLSGIWAVATTFLHFSGVIYNLYSVKPLEWSATEDKILTVLLLANMGISTMTQILSWYRKSTFERIASRLMIVDTTMKKFGAAIDHDGTMKIGIIVIIYWLTTSLVLNLLESLVLFPVGTPFITGFLFCSTLNHSIHVNSLIALIFLITLRIMRWRFHLLNELIENSFKSYYEQPRDINPWSVWLYRNSKIKPRCELSSQQLTRANENYKSLIQTLKHVHLELVLTMEYIQKMYGPMIVLQTGCMFISITGLTYHLASVATTDMILPVLHILCVCAWIGVPAMNFTIINGCCEDLTAEASRTANLILGIDNSIDDSELRDEIEQFSFQLITHPVSFSPLGFFTLGYPFLRSFGNTVVTHVVILLQSDQS